MAGDTLILSWTEGGTYMAKTNRYTLFSLRMFGEYDLDGTVNSNDFAAASGLTDSGWPVPVISNVLRRLLLKNDVRIPGDIILTSPVHPVSADGIR